MKKWEWNSSEEWESLVEQLWQQKEVVAEKERVNLRFEDKLRHAITVRHEVREGIRQTNERIEITIYQWIQKFMQRTQREMVIENVWHNGKNGQVRIDLFDGTMEYEESL